MLVAVTVTVIGAATHRDDSAAAAAETGALFDSPNMPPPYPGADADAVSAVLVIVTTFDLVDVSRMVVVTSTTEPSAFVVV